MVTRLDRPVSLLVVAVKAYALEEALDRIDPASLDGAVVLPLLNSLEHVDAIRARLGAGPVVAARSIGSVEAFSLSPASSSSGPRERRSRRPRTRRPPGSRAPPPLAVPGIDVQVTDGERRVLWEKAARLAVLAAAAMAAAKPLGQLATTPRGAATRGRAR